MNRLNEEWYARPEAVPAFAGDDLLEPTLVLLLIRYSGSIIDRDVLDLGMGPGRTTAYLTKLTSGYVGLDYSLPMVEHCSRRFPAFRIEHGDARDLSRFAPSSFDFVLFSAGAISALDHEGRLRALGEVKRTLRPGALFAFSVHNREFREAHQGPRLHVSRNPATLLMNVVRWGRNCWNHARRRTHEREHPEYAIINDMAEGFRLLHYYIEPRHQRRQLAEMGFEIVAEYDDALNAVQPDVRVAGSPFIWYVVRRAPGETAATT